MIRTLVLFASALVTLPLLGQSPTPAEIDAVFTAFDRPGSIGCALGVARDGEFLYKKGYGYAHLDWDLPITPTTVFYVGSLSKQFTAASIALLARQGKLALDDDIRKFLPELPTRDPPITVRHLIHHTSGVPDMYRVMREHNLTTWDQFSRPEALALLSKQDLDFAPGQQFQYSNGGYFLLSMVVERASGKTLREYAAEQIFRPLGMTDTHFHDDPVHVVKRRAMSYQVQPDDSLSYTQSYQGNFALPGAGGLYTTVEDFLLWDRNFLKNQLGGADFMEIIHTAGDLNSGEKLDYAFAIRAGSYRGLSTLGHTGSFMGFKAYAVRFPAQRFSTWVFCNMDDIVPQELGLRVAELYLENEMQDATGGN